MGGLSDRPQEQRLEVTKVMSFEGNFLEDNLSGYTLNVGVHPIQLVIFREDQAKNHSVCLRGFFFATV